MINYLAIRERSFPRIFEGKSSAPSVKTEGTDPPIPIPPIIRQNINQVTDGAKADAILAIVLIKSEYCKHGFLPILSDNKPHNKPPNNIPKNTAALKNSNKEKKKEIK